MQPISKKLKITNMKRTKIKLKNEENCLSIMFMLKNNSKTKNLIIIHSNNLDIIDIMTFK